MVLSVEAKKIDEERWEVYTDNGREGTGIDLIEWLIQGEGLGAGEILLTSVDCEGTRKGFDLELLKVATESVSIPVIASGGMGKYQDLYDAVYVADVDAIAMADILHYNRLTFDEIRKESTSSGIIVRDYD